MSIASAIKMWTDEASALIVTMIRYDIRINVLLYRLLWSQQPATFALYAGCLEGDYPTWLCSRNLSRRVDLSCQLWSASRLSSFTLTVEAMLMSRFQTASYYVCHYSPPGNVEGEYSYVPFVLFLFLLQFALNQPTVRMFRHKHLGLYAKRTACSWVLCCFVVIRYIRMYQVLSS